MGKLHKKKNIVCERNSIPFNKSEILKYLKELDGWDIKINSEKSFYLEKNFKFKNFIKSSEFVNKVCSIAESEEHHPDIYFGWGYAKIKILTHAIGGLAENDFILAAKIDQL
jgi:4a-hydroxytetrahydrobiopterin dehydratase